MSRPGPGVPDAGRETVREASPAADQAPVVLSVEDVVRHFPMRTGWLGRDRASVRAVDGVSFQLRRGETLGLVGESGCGKSTIARLIVLLDRPTSGRITLSGMDGGRLSSALRRRWHREVQMVFQDPYDSLHPRMRVDEIIGEAWRIHPDLVAPREREPRLRALLELVGLSVTHARRHPFELSGGQRQRVGLARALALQPELLICDEPVSALDVSIRAQVLNLLRDIQAELRLTCLFISHDLSVVRHVADRIAVMYLGRIAEEGTEDHVFGHPRHPYSQALISAVPAIDDPAAAGRKRIILRGDLPNPADPPSGCRFRTRCLVARPDCAERTPVLVADRDGHAVACPYAGGCQPAGSS